MNCVHGGPLTTCPTCWPAFQTERGRRGAVVRHSLQTAVNRVVDDVDELTEEQMTMLTVALRRELARPPWHKPR